MARVLVTWAVINPVAMWTKCASPDQAKKGKLCSDYEDAQAGPEVIFFFMLNSAEYESSTV